MSSSPSIPAPATSTALVPSPSPPPPPSRSLRVANGFFSMLRSLGLVPRQFDPETVFRKAISKADLTDFGDPSFRTGMDILLRSLHDDACLNPFGYAFLYGLMRDALVTRLRLVEYQKRRPEIFDQPLVPPLFIIGLPRSGTTHLHRLLCCAEDSRPVYTWEVFEPIPGKGLDLRRLQGRLGATVVRRLAPELDAKHELRGNSAEECFALFNGTFVSAGWWVLAPVFEYLEWYLEQDFRGPFRYYRALLQFLQSTSPGSRLTLKSPAYTGQLTEMLETFPDALVVQTHRDPCRVVPSAISLFESFHGLVTNHLDRPRLTDALLRMLSKMKENNLAALDRVPADRVVHVDFKDLVRDATGTARNIYERLGLPWTASLEARIREYEDRHPKDRHGVHRYTLEEYGLDEDRVRELFADYIERYLREG